LALAHNPAGSMTEPWKVVNADCVEHMQGMAESSVDAIVTDPPYGLRFMGKEWDDQGVGVQQAEWHRRWAVEALRVLKPGGHLLAFGGSRTYHHLATAVEVAGFEVRDQIMWLYGSGFPKSHDVSKAIDKAAGHWRGRAGAKTSANGSMENPNYKRSDKGNPATATALQWQGWGTALKPAHEPIVVARKPFVGTVAANVLEHGTGGINIDASRVGQADGFGGGAKATSGFVNGYESDGFVASTVGRWPANVILDEEAGRLLDEQSGGASRFFYCAKASKADRNAGLDKFDGAQIGAKGNGLARTCSTCNASVLDGCECPDRTFENPTRANHHPTVKPVNLMRYLVKLVTPPGGLVLDPFNGSGTTGIAAVLEGFQYLGIEQNAEYVKIADARIYFWSKDQQMDLGLAS